LRAERTHSLVWAPLTQGIWVDSSNVGGMRGKIDPSLPMSRKTAIVDVCDAVKAGMNNTSPGMLPGTGTGGNIGSGKRKFVRVRG